uniref:Uncharacterized protein n=1 Tax=Arundo donax TaxID=35708 RepID=A0A0A9DRV4_ARUDO
MESKLGDSFSLYFTTLKLVLVPLFRLHLMRPFKVAWMHFHAVKVKHVLVSLLPHLMIAMSTNLYHLLCKFVVLKT